MRTLYTFFDLLCSLLLKTIEKLPRPIKLVLYVLIFFPILCLAAYGDYRGWKSEDVL